MFSHKAAPGPLPEGWVRWIIDCGTFSCFPSSQRHIGNPTTGHHQEVRDTDSRAMGKGDRGPRKALFFLSTSLRRI